ncbi:MAG: hypothetical protein JW746_01680 [Candidatus Krumholzibacteriota bacterium]|nr:hypothetical protein [Candidatus Krumholzibacteriota bacterium]
MKKKNADIEDLLTTFADHIAGSYPEPKQFRDNIVSLLEQKRKGKTESDYILSLEKNIIFLSDLVIEGEAFLEMLLSQINDESPVDVKVENYLQEMESRVRANIPERYDEIFSGQKNEEFAELIDARDEGVTAYLEKLSFTYFYLTTFRMLLFEFLNILCVVREEYVIGRVDFAAPGHLISHIEMTANYYLGNVGVGEITADEED